MKNKRIVIIIMSIQIISLILYLLPYEDHAHIPISFMRVVIFGIFNLIVITVFGFLFFKKKPIGILWKLPFALFIGALLTGWFYTN